MQINFYKAKEMSQQISTDVTMRILTPKSELSDYGVATLSPVHSIVTYFPRNDEMYEERRVLDALKIILGKTSYRCCDFSCEFVSSYLDGPGRVNVKFNSLSHYRIRWLTRHALDDVDIEQEINLDGCSMLLLDSDGLKVMNREVFLSFYKKNLRGRYGILDADKHQGDWLNRNGSNLFSRYYAYVLGRDIYD